MGWLAQSRLWGPRAYLLKECLVWSWYFRTWVIFGSGCCWCTGGDDVVDMVACGGALYLAAATVVVVVVEGGGRW